MLYRRGAMYKMKYLAATILFLASGFHAFSENQPQLIIGNSGEPATLDPHKYNLRLEETLLNDLFLILVFYLFFFSFFYYGIYSYLTYGMKGLVLENILQQMDRNIL